MHGASGGGKKARIEIIPLIDIIFFLLATFIMVSLSMTKNQGVQVALPTASSASSLGDQAEMEKAVTLSVNAKGEVFYNKEKITIAQLPLKLQTLKSTAKDPKVVINSDAGADFKHVVAVLDEVRKIGISKVGIFAASRGNHVRQNALHRPWEEQGGGAAGGTVEQPGYGRRKREGERKGKAPGAGQEVDRGNAGGSASRRR